MVSCYITARPCSHQTSPISNTQFTWSFRVLTVRSQPPCGEALSTCTKGYPRGTPWLGGPRLIDGCQRVARATRGRTKTSATPHLIDVTATQTTSAAQRRRVRGGCGGRLWFLFTDDVDDPVARPELVLMAAKSGLRSSASSSASAEDLRAVLAASCRHEQQGRTLRRGAFELTTLLQSLHCGCTRPCVGTVGNVC